MSDELRAAAEEILATPFRRDRAGRLIPLAYSLARAYLAANPPGPVTPEWLAALGFDWCDEGSPTIRVGELTLSIDMETGAVDLDHDSGNGDWTPLGTARTLADVAMGVAWLRRIGGAA